jgi:CNT family concentrative nucleoside transporter
MAILHGLFGLAFLVGIALLFSNNRKKVNWRLVGAGFGLQIFFAVLILRGEELSTFFWPLGWPKTLFRWISYGFVKLLGFTTEGAKFVFGDLAIGPGSDGPG